MKVIVDCETDSLNPTKVWCAVCKDIATGNLYNFIGEDLYGGRFSDFLQSCDLVIGHNLVGFDIPIWDRLLNLTIPQSVVVDTLVLSRLAYPLRPGGHSIDNWGRILGREKPGHEDWSKFSPAMLHRCTEDVEINHLVYDHLKKTLTKFSEECIALEHAVAFLVQDMETYGFQLDLPRATHLLADLQTKEDDLRDALQHDFPSRTKQIREVAPKYKKDGTLSRVGLKSHHDDYQVVSGPFSTFERLDFNPDSPRQIVERLNEYGWKPTVPTPGQRAAKNRVRELKRALKNAHNQVRLEAVAKKLAEAEDNYDKLQEIGWKVCEENLQTVPDTAPEAARRLVDYKIIATRRRLVASWLDEADEAGLVHGQVNPIGTWTNRMAHRKPNMANVPSLKSPYGANCRRCWTHHPATRTGERVLLGADASGIQLRIFASLVGDADYIRRVVDPDSDIHVYHSRLLANLLGEQVSRDQAKTFIYAYLLGAGMAKVAEILGTPFSGGKAVIEGFPHSLPGLDDLQGYLDDVAKRGYDTLPDGRLLHIPDRHRALAGELQGIESVVMKKSWVTWDQWLGEQQLDVHTVAIVHDEFQNDALEAHAEPAGKLVQQAFKQTGLDLGIAAPLWGEYKIGPTWERTH